VKVWIAFTGEYDNRGVEGVYSDKAQAVAKTMPEAIAWRRTLEAQDPVNAARWPPVSEDDCDIECHELIASDSLDDAWAELEGVTGNSAIGVSKTVGVASGAYVATTDLGRPQDGYAYGDTPVAAVNRLLRKLWEAGQ
jgi:hypothetical protein